MKVTKKLRWVLCLALLSIIPLLDLTGPGMFLSHDGEAHIARLAAFYKSLTEGNIIPRWGGNLNAGFGHPVLMFLFPLPMYFGSVFHFFGFSFIDSIKLVFGFSFILSGLTMFFWVKEMWGEKAGFVAGILYLFAPYRFVDLYVRGAIGETLAFVWPPLICWFLLKLSKNLRWKFVLGGSLSMAALILSHNALSLMFIPIIIVYMGYLIILSQEKLLFTAYCLLLTVLGFGVSAFFWIPSFFEGKYTLRDIILSSGEYLNHFPNFWQLINSPWGYAGSPNGFSLQLGVVQWLIILTSPVILYVLSRKKDKSRFFVGFLMVLFILTLFILLPISLPVWQKISILPKFQFPWRFLSLAIFAPAVLAGSLIYTLPKNRQLVITILLILITLWINKNFWHARGYFLKDDNYFLNVYQGTTDTGESSPRWGIKGMEEVGRKNPIEVISGQADVKNINRLSNLHLYKVNVISNRAQFLENTLYFPGWTILVDDQETTIEFQDPHHRGLLTFFVPQGQHELRVVFNETKLRRTADLISLISVTVLIVGGILAISRLWPKFR